MYAVLSITVPSAQTAESKQAYEALARTFQNFNPRSALQA
jgi:hypothetical protein